MSNKVIKNTSEYSIASEFMYRNASIMHLLLKLAPSFGRKIYMRTFLRWENIKKLPFRIASVTPLLNLAEITFSHISCSFFVITVVGFGHKNIEVLYFSSCTSSLAQKYLHFTIRKLDTRKKSVHYLSTIKLYSIRLIQ